VSMTYGANANGTGAGPHQARSIGDGVGDHGRSCCACRSETGSGERRACVGTQCAAVFRAA
jgi:hypothetical protein